MRLKGTFKQNTCIHNAANFLNVTENKIRYNFYEINDVVYWEVIHDYT